MARGRSYARNGQIVALEIKGGKIIALVQGSRQTPYSVTIAFRRISVRNWKKIVDAMAGQAIFVAKLLAGEMPADIEAAFARSTARLFPRSGKDITMDCSCPDWAEPCKHIAAAFYLLGERFDADPFLMFALRGMTKDALLALLRGARGIRRATREKKIRENIQEKNIYTPLPLEIHMAEFYQLSPELKNVSFDFSLPTVSVPLLKRIPPPPYAPNRERWLEIMTLLYDDASKGTLPDGA